MVAVLLGCGSPAGSGDPSGGASSASCTLTLSGAMSGSYGCTQQSATWSDTTDTSTVTFVHGITGQTDPSIAAMITFPGAPLAGIHADTDAGAKTHVTVVSGTSTWAEVVGGAAPKSGSYTLVLTRVTPTKTTDYAQAYSISGTLDVTLLPAQGASASGSLTLHTTF